MAIQRESIKAIKHEIFQQDHWEDTKNFQDFKIDPDWDTYFLLEEMEKLYAFTCRDERDGGLIGYMVFLVSNYTHVKTMMFAELDVIYIVREHRGWGIAEGMMRFAVSFFKNLGIHSISLHVLESNPAHGMAENAGFEKMSTQYVRRLN